MRPSRGWGILVLTLVGVSGCAGMPQRGTTSSPMEAPTVASPARQSGWRGWWSRLRSPATAPAAATTPARAPAATFDPDLPIETSRRLGPERDIWPDQSQGPLSRLLSPGVRARTGDGPSIGLNEPPPKMTAAEANQAIARLARPRKTDDDSVLPVRMWDESKAPTLTPTPTFVDEQAPTELPAPTPRPGPGPFLERFSTQPPPDVLSEPAPDARNASTTGRRAEADPAEDAGPPPLVRQDPASDPDLVTVAQTPPPPPVRPSPRVSQTPPPPPIETTPPAVPQAVEPAEAVKPAESGDEATPPTAPDEHAPEAPAPSSPVAPPSEAAAAAVAPSVPSPTVQAPPQIVAAPQAGWASGRTLVDARPSDVSTPHRWSLLKWFRPRQTEHRHIHHPGVFPSPQGPVELPPVLVPTSYHASPPRPSGPPPSQQYVAPTAQQAYVAPSPQSPPPACQVKKPCVLVTRLHERIDQYRQWKHAHICKHIQSLKDMLAGKGRCHACGGAGTGPIPSAQGLPSPQERPPAPTPQAQTQSPSWSLF